MAVHVHPTGTNETTGGIDCGTGFLLVESANGDDPSLTDAHICAVSGVPGSVYNGSISDEQVVGPLPSLRHCCLRR